VPIPIEDAADMLKKFNMPTRLYPAFDWVAFNTAAIVVLLGVQFAAFVPGMRIGRLRPVDAMRLET
jgi:ABC-type lipoprotein release transport system permease subunit